MKISVAMNFGNRRFLNSGLSGGLVGHKFSPKLSGDRGVEEERRGERREERGERGETRGARPPSTSRANRGGQNSRTTLALNKTNAIFFLALGGSMAKTIGGTQNGTSQRPGQVRKHKDCLMKIRTAMKVGNRHFLNLGLFWGSAGLNLSPEVSVDRGVCLRRREVIRLVSGRWLKVSGGARGLAQ